MSERSQAVHGSYLARSEEREGTGTRNHDSQRKENGGARRDRREPRSLRRNCRFKKKEQLRRDEIAVRKRQVGGGASIKNNRQRKDSTQCQNERRWKNRQSLRKKIISVSRKQHEQQGMAHHQKRKNKDERELRVDGINSSSSSIGVRRHCHCDEEDVS